MKNGNIERNDLVRIARLGFFLGRVATKKKEGEHKEGETF